MTKQTIEVSYEAVDALIVRELKDSIRFCKRHQLYEFALAMEKTIQFYMTAAEYYDWVATMENENA